MVMFSAIHDNIRKVHMMAFWPVWMIINFSFLLSLSFFATLPQLPLTVLPNIGASTPDGRVAEHIMVNTNWTT